MPASRALNCSSGPPCALALGSGAALADGTTAPKLLIPRPSASIAIPMVLVRIDRCIVLLPRGAPGRRGPSAAPLTLRQQDSAHPSASSVKPATTRAWNASHPGARRTTVVREYGALLASCPPPRARPGGPPVATLQQ